MNRLGIPILHSALCLWPLLLFFHLIAASAYAVITLVSFTATAGDGQVLLRWETATEINNVGFFIRRSTQEDGEYIRISDFIPSKGDGLIGDKYAYLDEDVQNGITYFYKLEAVEHDQDTQFHGPVSATPGGTPTPTETVTAAPTSTPTETATATSTSMPTITHTATSSSTPTLTLTPTNTPVPTHTPSSTPTVPPTDTPTSVSTPVPTATPEPTPIPTHTPTATSTSVPTHTPSPALTESPTDTPTSVPTPTLTGTPVPTFTLSPILTALPTETATETPTWSLEISRATPALAVEPGPVTQPSSHLAIQPSPSPGPTDELPRSLASPAELLPSHPDWPLPQPTASPTPSMRQEPQELALEPPSTAHQPQDPSAGVTALENPSTRPGGWTTRLGHGLLSLVILAIAGGLFNLIRRGRGP